MYQINLKGFAPVYLYDKAEAMEKFRQIRARFSSCSIRRISYQRMLAKIHKEVCA